MKGCARTCLLWVAGWGAAAYAFYFYFVSLHDFGAPMYWGSVAAGLLVVVAIGYAIGIGTAHRERQMLLEAVSGTQPPDGRWVAVSGTIRSMEPLTAPISGMDVVAYEYRIYRDERQGKNTSARVYFQGKALAPSTIATAQGSVRLLAVPAFDLEAAAVPWQTAMENAKAYVRATAFVEREATATGRTKRLEDEWTDDDGRFRSDKRYSAREVDLGDDFRFEERHVAQGERVCAFGLYSQVRGGLVPHPNWSKQTRLMRGEAASVAAQLRRRMIRYGIGAVVCAALAWGIVKLYHYNVARLTVS